jgi:hypothetical protein
MTGCSIGSTRGYDEIVKNKVCVVKEAKLYQPTVNIKRGILEFRKEMNEIHKFLDMSGYIEQHTHLDGNIITIQRHNPANHDAFYATCHTSFWLTKYESPRRQTMNYKVKVPGKIKRIVGFYYLDVLHSDDDPSV